jgi:hypothetical protein
MRPREFVSVIGGVAAAWPLSAQAQLAAMPVSGHRDVGSPDGSVPFVAAWLVQAKLMARTSPLNIARRMTAGLEF